MCKMVITNKSNDIVDISEPQYKPLSYKIIESNKRILNLIKEQAEWIDTEWLPDDFKG